MEDTHVYVYLSQKNTSAAFKQMHRCLDNMKELMSTSKLKLNPDKTSLHSLVKKTEGMLNV